MFILFFKQKTEYEMRISDWSSDVCSSDLIRRLTVLVDGVPIDIACANEMNAPLSYTDPQTIDAISVITGVTPVSMGGDSIGGAISVETQTPRFAKAGETLLTGELSRSEEQTSELKSLQSSSSSVF